MRFGRIVLCWLGVGVGFVAPAAAPAAEKVECIACHSDPSLMQTSRKANLYFQLWLTSNHSSHGVTCVKCHGGDPSLAGKEAAHASMDMPPAKMTAANVLKRCGSCHEEQLTAFTTSKHYKALAEKGMRGRLPTCVTCHGKVRSEAMTSKRVREACAACHNAKSKNHPEIPETAEHYLAGFESIKARERAEHKGEGHIPALVREWHTFDLDLVGGDIARFAQAAE